MNMKKEKIAELSRYFRGDKDWEEFLASHDVNYKLISDLRKQCLQVLANKVVSPKEWMDEPVGALAKMTPNEVLTMGEMGERALKLTIMRMP